MKKFITIMITAAISVLCLCGCGGGKDIDMNGLAQELIASDIFDEKLESVSDSVTMKRLAINSDAVDGAVCYVGTNAVVDEIIIMKAANDKGKESVENGIKAHIDSQKKSYQSYAPDQVPKLEDCVNISKGKYQILVVSNDNSKAKQLVKDFIK